MRVITGSIKGHPLKTVQNRALRPTSGKVKEALFNILQKEISGSCFLDLYAGTGSIGIEALSRGACHVTFVESNRAILKILRHNLKRLGFETKSSILGMTALKFLKSKSLSNQRFDILYVDPPYHGSELKKLLPLLTCSDMIKSNSLMIIEHFHKTEMESSIGALQKRRTYLYGDTSLTVYEMG